ncbi:MAG: hypothetical protein WDN49_04835 [Acetobacteraceae bacterium]
MGADEWRFVVDRHDMPTAVGGVYLRLHPGGTLFRAAPDHRGTPVSR